jgi:HEAT repeat protein
MAATAKLPYERTFGILRRGLGDEDEAVRIEARRALGTMGVRSALQPLIRLYRDSKEEAVRQTIVAAVADIGRREAGLFLLDVVRSESGPVFDTAVKRLRSFPLADLWPVIRQIAESERGPVKEALDSILAGAPAAVRA